MTLLSSFLKVAKGGEAPLLCGKLLKQEGAGTSKGKTKVGYYTCNNILVIGDLGDIGYLGNTDNLYWLPWKYGAVNSVTWEDLNESECDVFLTSEFSGCRLSITASGISHSAYHQLTGFEFFLTLPKLTNDTFGNNDGPYALNHSNLRDHAEKFDPVAKSKTIRRSSISDSESGYGSSALKSRMIAVGLKHNDQWVIREFHFSNNNRTISKMVSTQVKTKTSLKTKKSTASTKVQTKKNLKAKKIVTLT